MAQQKLNFESCKISHINKISHLISSFSIGLLKQFYYFAYSKFKGMKKLILSLGIGLSILSGFNATAQRNCGSHDHHVHQMQTDPEYAKNQESIENHTAAYLNNPNKKRVVVTIPVVVHVVYNTTAQNISDAQIQSQMNILNADFRKLNADASLIPSLFQGVAADCEINFCLAAQDPNGNATNGIVRRSTTVTSFSSNNAIKYTAQGGSDIWDRNRYLNIWVGNLSGGLLGYAQFPGGTAATDGVVCTFTAFGNIGTAASPFNKGRTATHEVGHWLNLRHIWGDATCGSDLVNDTPPHNTSNAGCPAYPHYSTCTGTPVEMTMNYMDYTDDACMYMFTQGQKDRMQAVFATGGARVSLLTSNGCTAPNPTACGTPSGVAASNITTTSATINWTAVSGALSYDVQYKLSSASTWNTLTASTNTSSLTGLAAGSAYNVQVRANCSASSSNYSTAINFNTTSTGGGGSCTNNYEPNESRTASATIATNINILSMIGSSTDRDYFKFTTTSSAPKIRIDLSTLPADYDVRLYRSNGSQIGASSNAGTTAEVIKYNTATTGSTYYIQVFGYNGAFSTSQCYTLKASTAATNFRMDNSEEISNKAELDIYPNPANTKISLRFFAGENHQVQATIFNAMGQKVISQQVTTTEGENNIHFNVESLPNGIYMMEWFDGEERKIQKFMVSK